MTARRADTLCLLMIALAFIVAALLYGRLPDPVPTHWNAAGEADGFTAKPWGALILPLATLGVYLLLRVLPAISPAGFRMDRFIGVYRIIVVAVVALLFAITVVALIAASGGDVDLPRLLPFGLGVLFVVIGNYMGKLERNFFIGIRTPWTLASEEVWVRTHRFGAKLFVAAGILIVAGGALEWSVPWIAAIVAVTAVASVLYSLVVYFRIEHEGDS